MAWFWIEASRSWFPDPKERSRVERVGDGAGSPHGGGLLAQVLCPVLGPGSCSLSMEPLCTPEQSRRVTALPAGLAAAPRAFSANVAGFGMEISQQLPGPWH